MSTVGVFQLGVVLTLKDMATSKLDEINAKWDTMRKNLGDTHADVIKMDKAISNMKVGGALLGAGLAVGAFTKQFVDARMESSKLEANIRSLGVSAEEVDSISNATAIMSSEFGIANETILTGIYDLKSAISTLDPKEAAAVAENLGKAAVATKGDLAGLADLFGTTHAQFKSMYQESDVAFSQRFANTLAMSVQAFKTDGAKMQSAMMALGASAASMGVTLEEEMAVLGTLQNTMNPGVAGTAYRAFLSNVGKGFKELGLNAADADGKMKSMPLLLKELEGKFKNAFIIDKNTGNTVLNLDARNMLKKAFGTEEAVAAIEALLPKAGSLTEAIEMWQKANASGKPGALEEMAKANMDSLPAQLDRISNSWKNMQGFIGKGLEGAGLKTFFKIIGDGMVFVNSFLLSHPKFAEFIGTFLSMATVGLTVGGSILFIYGAYKAFMFLVNASLISNPFGWLILGVVAAIAALAAIIVYWDDIKAAWADAPDWARGLAYLLVWPILEIINISKSIYENWDAIIGFLSSIPGKIAQNLFGPIGALWNTLPDSAKSAGIGMLKAFGEGILAGGKWALDNLKNVLGSFAKFLPHSNAKEGPLSNLTGSGEAFLPTFAQGIESGQDKGKSSLHDALSSWRKLLPGSNAEEGPFSSLTEAGQITVQSFAQGIEFEAPKMNPLLARFNDSLKSDSKGILKSDEMKEEFKSSGTGTGGGLQIGSIIGQLIMEGGKGNKSRVGEILADALFEEIERHEEVVV